MVRSGLWRWTLSGLVGIRHGRSPHPSSPARWKSPGPPTKPDSLAHRPAPATLCSSPMRMEVIPGKYTWNTPAAIVTISPGRRTARFIYFVKGNPTSDEMDIWRIRASECSTLRALSGSLPITPESLSAWLDGRTLIYSARLKMARASPCIRLTWSAGSRTGSAPGSRNSISRSRPVPPAPGGSSARLPIRR